jgi:hypothetical protein
MNGRQSLPASMVDSDAEPDYTGAFSAALYAGFVLAVSLAMLFLNSMLCVVIYAALPKMGGNTLAIAIQQLMYYLAPVFLTFLQWYLVDVVTRLIRR